jgi:hypothetical protein
MRDIFASVAVGVVALAALASVPASAGSAVTFVSGKGSDSGACATPATACRKFAHALTQTNSGGEIKTLDPADYGKASIVKSVTITGVPGASIEMTGAGAGVVVDNAAATVTLRGIEINGQGVGTRGIDIVAAKLVNIVDCMVHRVTAHGVFIAPATGAVSATISNTISSNNGDFGIAFVPGVGAAVKASVDHTTTNENGSVGMLVSSNARVMISDSIANDNAIDGFRASGNATSKMYLARSVASGNGTGIQNGAGIHNVSSSTVKSFGDNEVYGNGNEVDGTVGVVPSK